MPSALRVRRRLVLGSCWRDARWFGEAESGEVSFGAFAEGRHEAAVVAGGGGQDDVARLDAFEGNGGEVGAQAADADAGRDDGHGLPAGDEFELVLDGFDEGTGCPSGRGSGESPILSPPGFRVGCFVPDS